VAREPDLLQDYINKARYIAETLSNLTVELADKGCMSYKQANKAHELIMDVLRVLARRQWSSINFVCDRIANIMDTIADAWKECQKA
jgi:polyhydroxyalkanoate synthesis regulator phasin